MNNKKILLTFMKVIVSATIMLVCMFFSQEYFNSIFSWLLSEPSIIDAIALFSMFAFGMIIYIVILHILGVRDLSSLVLKIIRKLDFRKE